MHRILFGRLLIMLFLLVAVLFALVGCTYGVPAERVHSMNNEWLRVYELDRRMTAEEEAQYAALSDEKKIEWVKEGKPAPQPLSPRMLDAARDHHVAVRMEAEAAD